MQEMQKIWYNDTDRLQRTAVYNNNDKRVDKHDTDTESIIIY